MVKRKVIDNGVRFDPIMPAKQDFDFLVQVCQNFTLGFTEQILVRVNHPEESRVYTSQSSLLAMHQLLIKHSEL